MSGQITYPHKLCVMVTGKVGLITDKTQRTSVKMVYQRVGAGFGNVKRGKIRDLQLRRHAPQQDPRRPEQLAGRRRIKAATRAYQALTQELRDLWATLATDKPITGFNLFVSMYCKSHALQEFIKERVKLEFYGESKSIQRPFTAIKFYILSR